MKKANRSQRTQGSFVGLVAFWSLLILIQVFVLIYILRTTEAWDIIKIRLSEFYIFISKHALLLLVGMLFLPTFGIPISPFFVLAGAIWGIHVGLTICFLCIGFNLIFSYFFYRKCLNKFLFKLIFRKKGIPNIKKRSDLSSFKWVFLIQLVPHLPYSAQCYILSTVQDIRFWHYLGLSWIVQFIWACGFVCGGQAIKTGEWGLTIFCILLIGIFLTRKAYHYFKKLDKTSC